MWRYHGAGDDSIDAAAEAMAERLKRMENMLILSLALLILGLVVTAVEIFVPSGGLLAIFAVFCFGGCLYCAYQVSGAAAGTMAVIQVVCIPTVVAVGFKILPRTSLGRQLMLSRKREPDGVSSGATRPTTVSQQNEWADLRGREGVAVTPLRPSGTADIDKKRFSVVTEGSHIHTGTRIRVVLVEGGRIVVEAIDATNARAES